MLYELKPREYETVRPTFAEWYLYLAIFAVIDGKCPGSIYVDNRENPQTALLWDHAEGELYLAGDARDASLDRALNDCIRHRMRPHAQAHLPHLSEYTLYCDPETWGSKLDVVLDGLNPMEHRRRLYTLKAPRGDWRSRVPEGFEMARIDETFLARRDLKEIDTMNEWVLGDWRAASDFANRETGFCLIHDGELVSWCASEYTTEPIPGAGKACHVGIYTCEEYRRRGFATLVASATVERILANGVEHIGWHCWESNLASAATARKAGFELAHDQPVYNGCWNQFDNLLLQAHYHSQANRMADAVARWERAFEMWEARDPEALSAPHVKAHPDAIAWSYYAAGRARAQQGDIAIAIAHLHKAVDNGWRDGERLREDDGLAGLHSTPGWDELLSRLG